MNFSDYLAPANILSAKLTKKIRRFDDFFFFVCFLFFFLQILYVQFLHKKFGINGVSLNVQFRPLISFKKHIRNQTLKFTSAFL